MRDWFESLELRERWIVSAGAVLVVFAVLYSFAWAPLDRNYKTLESDIQVLQRSLAALRPLRLRAPDGEQPGSAAVLGSQLSPLIIVDQTLRSRGLDRYRQRSQPTTSNGVRVEFENVAFDELVLWLGDLSAQYAMHVKIGSFSAGSRVVPGRINASLTLERAL
jgi:general secretion pathway protein M